MSEPGKAVFLSYASQDAEAAKKICDALRAAGVEVWFDQSELVGGDAWDAKIRGHISSCALFMPVISANTQARREGYFRLEWKLAAQRTHMIADGTPFLVPLVIDGTRDPDALVPAEFKAVQWTRLPGGETTEKFCTRVQKLLANEAFEVAPAAAAPVARGYSRSKWWWVLPIFGVSMMLVLVLKERSPAALPKPPASVPASEARQLAGQAHALIDKPGANFTELDAADHLCEKAARLDPADAEVRAAWSQVCSWLVFHYFDTSSERRAAAKSNATLAQQLAPDSYEARFALALYFMRYVGGLGDSDDEKAYAFMQGLLRERPDDPRVLLLLGVQQGRSSHVDEARATLDRLAKNPTYAAAAWGEKGWAEMLAANYAAAEAAVDRANGIDLLWRNLALKSLLALDWRGDPDLALATAQRLPDAMSQQRLSMMGPYLQLLRRDPNQALHLLESMPDNWQSNGGYEGPTAVLRALANEQLHQDERAELQWQLALRLIEEHLEHGLDLRTQMLKAYVLAALHRPADAEAALKVVPDADTYRPLPWMARNRYLLTLVRLGHTETAMNYLERDPRLTAAVLRIDPELDPLRAMPRFQALQARLEADPSRSPNAKASPVAAASAAPDDKSVAVLAFANLSDDKSNEYFSDGISEELLNVLAKVPGLKVTARTSSFHFKGTNTAIPEIAKELGVAYVVEGSVRKSGDKVRITAQLIKADGGFHVWSDTFTRDLKDVFAVQDEIAGLIAQNLRAKMAINRERSTVAPEAYALVLQARHAAARQTIEGGREAVKLYREVLALAPDAVDAWAELAYAYQYLARFGGMDTAEGMREARLAARKALELDPEQPLALAAFGWVQRTDDHDWRGAVQSFRHALAVAPENAALMSDAAICFLNVGLVDEAIALASRAAERDPLNPKTHWSRGIVLTFAGKVAEAEAPYRRAVELAPAADEYRSHLARVLTVLNRLEEAKTIALAEPSERYRISTLAGIYFRAGDNAAAERLMAELIAKYGGSMAGYIAAVYAQAGNRDESFKWLERGYETRDAAVAWVKTSSFLESLHDDPRWPVFLRKMGLADDQLK